MTPLLPLTPHPRVVTTVTGGGRRDLPESRGLLHSSQGSTREGDVKEGQRVGDSSHRDVCGGCTDQRRGVTGVSVTCVVGPLGERDGMAFPHSGSLGSGQEGSWASGLPSRSGSKLSTVESAPVRTPSPLLTRRTVSTSTRRYPVPEETFLGGAGPTGVRPEGSRGIGRSERPHDSCLVRRTTGAPPSTRNTHFDTTTVQ